MFIGRSAFNQLISERDHARADNFMLRDKLASISGKKPKSFAVHTADDKVVFVDACAFTVPGINQYCTTHSYQFFDAAGLVIASFPEEMVRYVLTSNPPSDRMKG